MNVILDVGSGPGNSFGHWRDREKELAPAKLYCFEPSPRHLPFLMMHAHEFRALYDITICPFGLGGMGDNSIVEEFYQKDDQSGDSFDINLCRHDGLRLTNLTPGYRMHVPLIEAGDYICNISEPGDGLYIKLDCEGSEYSILKNLLTYPSILEQIKEIQVEFHYPFIGKTELEEKYKSKGIELKPWPY